MLLRANIPPWRVLPAPEVTVGQIVESHYAFVVCPGDATREPFLPVAPTPPARAAG